MYTYTHAHIGIGSVNWGKLMSLATARKTSGNGHPLLKKLSQIINARKELASFTNSISKTAIPTLQFVFARRK